MKSVYTELNMQENIYIRSVSLLFTLLCVAKPVSEWPEFIAAYRALQWHPCSVRATIRQAREK